MMIVKCCILHYHLNKFALLDDCFIMPFLLRSFFLNFLINGFLFSFFRMHEPS
jgi:hypothetical protein